MKKPLLKKLLPHIIAIVIFLTISMLFCKPALEGNVLNQHDIVGWKGMAQNAFEYKEKNGHFPLWNPNLFSGMPNYQIALEGKSVFPNLPAILSFGLPKPINYFFLACLCFYVLTLVLTVRSIIGILGSLAFAFSTYNIVILNAGHESQMLATAFVPLLLAGLIAVFEKKYWLGFALATYGSYQQIGANHIQISFYFLLIAIAITIPYLYNWIRNKEWKHIALAGGITAIAAISGLAGNALVLMTTSEYTPFTIRGGKDISINGDTVDSVKTSGLDTSYAFQYSLAKSEAATLILPDAFGGSSTKSTDENSHVVKKLIGIGVAEGNAQQLAQSLPKYWGALPYTAGPAYLGVAICLLGLLGFVFVKTPMRWGLLAVTVLAICMSWGKHFASFNTFLFEHLPVYNKFRAPAMALVIPQITASIFTVLVLQRILFPKPAELTNKIDLKKIFYYAGGLFAFLGLMYIMTDYSASIDRQLLTNQWDKNPASSDEIGRSIVSGLKADRSGMFGGQLLRAIGFGILILGALYLYLKNILKKPFIVAGFLILITGIDLLMIDKEYLNDENYQTPDEMMNENFTASAIDQRILQDKDPDFRVFNMAGDTYNESRTSYFHKSIGGYHPAKLRIYQDLIEKYLSENPNPGILDMLNAKYIIMAGSQSGQPIVQQNPGALGHCWLVKNVKLVNNTVEEIVSIGKTNLKDTAIVNASFGKIIIPPHWDSASSITLTKFDNDLMEYEANCNGPQFAVFSEIYYPKGWNAYVDDKKTDYCKVNYVLRGLSLLSGKHTVKFVFEPGSVKKGTTIMYIFSFFILLFFFGGLFMAWRESRKQPVDA